MKTIDKINNALSYLDEKELEALRALIYVMAERKLGEVKQ